MMRMRPSQKEGTEKPAKARRLIVPSTIPRGYMAATMPAGMAMSSARTRLVPIKSSVLTQPRPDHLEHRAGVEPGIAEIAGERVAEPGRVALVERPVEAVERLQPSGIGGREVGVGADHEVDRVARHEADQPIDQERHQQQQEGRLGEPPIEVAAHRVRSTASAAHSSSTTRQLSTPRLVAAWCPAGSTPSSQRGQICASERK